MTFGREFSIAVCEGCGALSQPGYPVSPEWVCSVIALESDFDPEAESGAGARGLWQKMPEKGVPYQVSDPVQQLRDYIRFTLAQRNRFAVNKRFETREGLYLANFAPGRLLIGQTPDVVVYSAPGEPYRQNARSFGKDPNDPHGRITVGDLAVGLDAAIARNKARYAAEVEAAHAANATGKT